MVNCLLLTYYVSYSFIYYTVRGCRNLQNKANSFDDYSERPSYTTNRKLVLSEVLQSLTSYVFINQRMKPPFSILGVASRGSELFSHFRENYELKDVEQVCQLSRGRNNY